MKGTHRKVLKNEKIEPDKEKDFPGDKTISASKCLTSLFVCQLSNLHLPNSRLLYQLQTQNLCLDG